MGKSGVDLVCIYTEKREFFLRGEIWGGGGGLFSQNERKVGGGG